MSVWIDYLIPKLKHGYYELIRHDSTLTDANLLSYMHGYARRLFNASLGLFVIVWD